VTEWQVARGGEGGRPGARHGAGRQAGGAGAAGAGPAEEEQEEQENEKEEQEEEEKQQEEEEYLRRSALESTGSSRSVKCWWERSRRKGAAGRSRRGDTWAVQGSVVQCSAVQCSAVQQDTLILLVSTVLTSISVSASLSPVTPLVARSRPPSTRVLGGEGEEGEEGRGRSRYLGEPSAASSAATYRSWTAGRGRRPASSWPAFASCRAAPAPARIGRRME
jgi:hypothetical protein